MITINSTAENIIFIIRGSNVTEWSLLWTSSSIVNTHLWHGFDCNKDNKSFFAHTYRTFCCRTSGSLQQVLTFKINEPNGHFFSSNDTDNLQMSQWTLQEAAVHVKEMHLCLNTVRLMCGFNCSKGSIQFCSSVKGVAAYVATPFTLLQYSSLQWF